MFKQFENLQPPNLKPLATVLQVSKLLQINKQRAYELIRQGILPSVKLGRQIRVDLSVLEEWIKRGGTKNSLPNKDC